MFLPDVGFVVLTTAWWHTEQIAVLYWKNLVKLATLALNLANPSGVCSNCASRLNSSLS
jgi:hypothetical protein